MFIYVFIFVNIKYNFRSHRFTNIKYHTNFINFFKNPLGMILRGRQVHEKMRGCAFVYLEMFIGDRKSLDTREWSQQSLAGSPGPGLIRTNSTVCFLCPQRFLRQSTVESQESRDVKRKNSEAQKGQQ